MSMKIEAVAAAFPSRTVCNHEILSLIRQHSSETFHGDLDQCLRRIGRYLRLSGANHRLWLAPGETPLQLAKDAIAKALQSANCSEKEVDLMIWVGIGKGCMEPGQSYLMAQALGWNHVECFDILDACMSWMRALQMAEALLTTGRYRRILVVNSECNTVEGGPLYPGNYRLFDESQVEWMFPSYTIGTGASATLLTADANLPPWRWAFQSRPDLADLCSVATESWEHYCAPSDKIAKNGPWRFVSFGSALHDAAEQPLQEVFAKAVPRKEEIKGVFTHSSSWAEWREFAQLAGMEDRLHCVYPEYGNLVSASVPAALYLAQEKQAIKRGDRLAFWVGSAGMSFAACSFEY
ncbi:3-oxoacyl-[acyl-carrier-protein] synthase III C-terminal domain-containing protein [Massilia sp. W12]|uniref:3-oxoacyl-ACP synthase III family protein n=1 Tax=Massilia sp. W12 TaxID=3126507 RepID=UPI0030CAC242